MPSADPLSNHPRQLELRLFAGFELVQAGESLEAPTQLAQRLLAYLALHPAQQPREVIAEALWPEAPPGQGRRNLSDQLYQLRKSVGEGWLHADSNWLRLNQEQVQVDLHEFEGLLARGDDESLAEAVELYRGDLLPGFYDDWILVQRLSAREAYLAALAEFGERQLARGENEPAAATLRRLVHEDPLREQAVRSLMRALAAAGHIPRALQAYAELETHLRVELEAPPSEATQGLLDQLEAELAARQQPAPPRARRLPFVGRRSERAAGLRLVERAGHGSGGALAFEGPPGIGKTRLLNEIAAGAGWRAAQVAWGTASETPSRPYESLAQALEASLDGPLAHQAERLLPPETRAALAPLWPDWQDAAELPSVPQELAFDRLAQALADCWTALAQVKPLVLILDDFQWAPPDQWRLLDPLVAKLAQQSIALLIAFRRDELEGSGAWQILLEWERNSLVSVSPLAPLGKEDLARLLPASRAPEADDLLRRTGGVPLYLVDALAAEDGAAAAADPWQARAGRLTEQQQTALQAAAVLAEGFTFDAWQAVSSLTADELAAAAAELVQRGFLRSDDSHYQFAHDLVRSSSYELVPAEQAAQLHQRAAAHLAQTSTSPERAAHHLAQSGQVRKAAHSYLTAGEQALSHYATAEAASCFRRGLTLAPEGAHELHYELATKLAEALQLDPDPAARAEALATAQAAAAAMQDNHRLVEVLLGVTDLRARAGELKPAAQALERARAINAELDDPQLTLKLSSAEGDLALRQGQLERASEAFRRAADKGKVLGAAAARGRALDGLAFSLASLGASFEEISGYFEQALVLFRQQGDAYNEARTLLNYFSACQNAAAWDQMEAMAPDVFGALEAVGYRLGEGIARQAYGMAACYLGDFEAAQEHLSLAADRFREAGDSFAVSLATTGLGQVLWRRGEAAAAETRLREARRLAQGAQATLPLAFADQELGRVLLELERPQEAQALLSEAVEAWEQIGDPGNQALCRVLLGHCSLQLGDEPAARAVAEKSLAALPDAPAQVEGEEPQLRLWALHRLLSALEQQDEAQQVLARAAAALQQQAASLTDIEDRRRFLLAVPTNRAVALAWQEAQEVPAETTVRLASASAPLGRQLRAEEQVSVRWTVNSPEDETLTDNVERRRYVLRRLLRQAAEQGAAPTDQDLAEVLQVSRRTIVRDMKALEQAGHVPATRRRGR